RRGRCSFRSDRWTSSASRRVMAGFSSGRPCSARSSGLPFGSFLSAADSSAQRRAGAPLNAGQAVELVSHSSLHTERVGERIARTSPTRSGPSRCAPPVRDRPSSWRVSVTLLALDTSTEWASVALYDGRDVLAEETWHAQRRHADELFPTIERLLARTHITLASIDKVAVATGPGSFTGLRIAIATAQGLARGAGAALVGISTLDVLAYPHAA